MPHYGRKIIYNYRYKNRLKDRRRLACVPSDSRMFRLCSFRFAGGTPASQDRGRPACMRLYSTANERA
ncbi:MAG: hypothetical protein LBP59_07725 [Planctomycetaceae bacterium]|nr:hypothetical protein [Planctomycetaceae bacterium]